MVPFSADFREQFHLLHEKTYGYCNRDKNIEVVNVRLRALGKPEKPEFPKLPFVGEKLVPEALLDERDVVFDGVSERTRIISREKLQHGNLFAGPAILIEYSSTIVIPPFAAARVDEFGNIILTIND